MATIVNDYRALLYGTYWFPTLASAGPIVAAPQPVVVSYSFLQSAGASIVASSPATAATFQAFSAADEAVARAELQQWAQVSGITFVETTASEGDITFGYYNLTTMGYAGAAGLGNYPSSGAYIIGGGTPETYSGEVTTAGDIYVDTSYASTPSLQADLGHVLVHEIGHTLGLKHPFDDGAYTLNPALDNGSETVMSYTGARLDVPGPLDVAAVQSIYGVYGATSASWTWAWDAAREIYTVHSVGDGQFVRGVGAKEDIIYAPGVNDAVVTAQGNDVVYASGQALSINTGLGNDTVYTGLTYSALAWGVQGSGDFRYVAVAGGFQEYDSVETLVFSDGVYATATNRFTSLPPLTVQAFSAALGEGDGPFKFTLTRTDSTAMARVVNWAVASSGANPADAADFAGGVLPSGTVTFAAGQMEQNVTIALFNDTLAEADEQFTLQLSDPTTGAAAGSATATIVNDDTSVDIVATSLVGAEGNGGSTPFVFTVTRSGLLTATVGVHWAVHGAGATPATGDDFVGGALPHDLVNFFAGASLVRVTLAVAGDTHAESDEGFSVTLSGVMSSDPTHSLTIGTATVTGTILNDDTSISVAAPSAQAEGDSGSTPFAFVLSRSGDTSQMQTVAYAVTGVAAAPADAADFTGGVLPSGVFTFAAGQTTGTLEIGVAGDSVVEPSESFTLSLSNPSGGATLHPASASMTILNDDALVEISGADLVQTEGASGNTAFAFMLSRYGATPAGRTVDWAVSGFGANSATGSDFSGGVFPFGTVTFAAGETSRSVTFNVAGDDAVELPESFVVSLSNPGPGVTLGTASADGLIGNDDAQVSIASTAANQAEGNSGSTAFTFTVTRSGDTSVAQSVVWAVAGDGDAPADATDFAGGVLPGGTVSFAAGVVSQTITVAVAGDAAVETDEGFSVTLSGAASGDPTHSLTIGIATAAGSIVNDDTSLSLAGSDASKAEGNSGATPFVFTVTRAGNLSGASRAAWSVVGLAPASANPADFVGGVVPSGTVSFAAGESSRTITVNVAGDTLAEADEGFQVVLSRPVGATVAVGSAAATIVNDDTNFAIASTTGSHLEGNSGATPFVFTVTRSGITSGANSVAWSVVGALPNSAGPSDFVGGAPPSGTLSFAAGVLSQTLTVNVAGDTALEPDEYFQVVLGQTTGGATIATGSALGKIVNDDTGFSIAATDAVKAEGNSGPTALVFTVTRSGNIGGTHAVAWQVSGALPNTAGPGDFVGGVVPSGGLVFTQGEVSKTLTVEVQGDTTVEADEHFTVLLHNPTGGAAILVGHAEGSILNDDGGVPADIAGSLATVATADFNGDGTTDLLRQAPGGDLYVLNGASGVQGAVSQAAAGLSFVAAADFGGDGRADILLQGGGGGLYAWTMAGAQVQHSDLVTVLGGGQTVAGVADYTGDGRADILLANAPAQAGGTQVGGSQVGGSGGWTLLAMQDGTVASSTNLASLPDAWHVGV